MMVLSHVAVGGAVGSVIQNPFLAFFLGIVIHLIMDKVPHFWPKKTENEVYFKAIDIGLSLLLMLVYWLVGFHSVSFWAGVMGNLSVDLVTVGIKPIKEARLGQWQEKRQPHVAKPIYLLTDTCFIIIGLYFLWGLR
ncbi:MAG: hypothetical protein WC437_02085 [Patescibacteria group bacterium]|jgi:hypothetical protein|nr:hypothetical protein [Patescibacteria group bacterium]